MTGSAGWSERYHHTCVAMPDNSLVLMGGSNLDDVWRSTDDGATWTQLTQAAAWSARWEHTSVVTRDGSILLAGGNSLNDIWMFSPSGSSEQNPAHSYSAIGKYAVALQVFNSAGYSSLWKPDYITVPPAAAFTGTPTTGTVPLTVAFTDTSTSTPTVWNWSFGDGNYSNLQNPTHTYTEAGTYSVSAAAQCRLPFSSFSLQRMHRRACGSASRRSNAISSPQLSHLPYLSGVS